jgi:hypothetical protein
VNVPDISGDGITHLEFNEIARNNLAGGDDMRPALADDVSGGRAKRSEGIHGLFGRVFLEETNDDVQENDKSNNTSLNPRLEAIRHSHGKDKDLFRGHVLVRFTSNANGVEIEGHIKLNWVEEPGTRVFARPNSFFATEHKHRDVPTIVMAFAI